MEPKVLTRAVHGPRDEARPCGRPNGSPALLFGATTLPGAHGRSWQAMIHAALIPMGDWCDLHGANVNHLMKNLGAV